MLVLALNQALVSLKPNFVAMPHSSTPLVVQLIQQHIDNRFNSHKQHIDHHQNLQDLLAASAPLD